MTCVQLREKELEKEKFLEEALEMKKLCTKYQIPFIINDNVEIVLECKADGIALVSAIFAAENIEETCKELKSISKKMVGRC